MKASRKTPRLTSRNRTPRWLTNHTVHPVTLGGLSSQEVAQTRQAYSKRQSKLPESHRTVLSHITSMGIAQPRLAKKTKLAASPLSTILGELEDKQLIKRTRLHSDLRVNVVHLRAKGVKAVAKLAAGY